MLLQMYDGYITESRAPVERRLYPQLELAHRANHEHRDRCVILGGGSLPVTGVGAIFPRPRSLRTHQHRTFFLHMKSV